MLMIVSKTVLVVLAGVYAMRATGIIFHPQPLQPLMGVAAFAFVMAVVLFQNPPTVPGWQLYTVIGLCLFGVAANTMLFFAPDAAHNTPTNLAFSAVSMVGWGWLVFAFGLRAFGSAESTV
jgi:hypothetical protein